MTQRGETWVQEAQSDLAKAAVRLSEDQPVWS